MTTVIVTPEIIAADRRATIGLVYQDNISKFISWPAKGIVFVTAGSFSLQFIIINHLMTGEWNGDEEKEFCMANHREVKLRWVDSYGFYREGNAVLTDGKYVLMTTSGFMTENPKEMLHALGSGGPYARGALLNKPGDLKNAFKVASLLDPHTSSCYQVLNRASRELTSYNEKGEVTNVITLK